MLATAHGGSRCSLQDFCTCACCGEASMGWQAITARWLLLCCRRCHGCRPCLSTAWAKPAPCLVTITLIQTCRGANRLECQRPYWP